MPSTKKEKEGGPTTGTEAKNDKPREGKKKKQTKRGHNACEK